MRTIPGPYSSSTSACARPSASATTSMKTIGGSPPVSDPRSLSPRLWEARLHLFADLRELLGGRNVALDDAERAVPHLADRDLVTVGLPRKDGDEDDRAELLQLLVEVVVPGDDVVRLRPRVRVRPACLLLRVVLRLGRNPAALGLRTGILVDVGLGHIGLFERPHFGNGEHLTVEPADNVVAAPGRPVHGPLAADRLPVPVGNPNVAALRRQRQQDPTQAEHRPIRGVQHGRARLVELRRIG